MVRKPSPHRWRQVRVAGLALTLVGTVGALLWWQIGWWPPFEMPVPAASPDRPTVVLIVLDTVRADRMSLCGYDRPTTPAIDELAGGGVHTCRAVAPGAATLPSHASFFTGLPVQAHGAGLWSEDGLTPLGADHETLAEAFAADGYQTVLLSANPVLSDVAGLQQGFDVVWTAAAFGDLDRDRAPRKLTDLLYRRVDRDRPLFLVINLSDAHEPYPAVEGVEWIGRDWPELAMHAHDSESPYARLVAGTLDDEARAEAVAHLSDSYDLGIRHSDDAVARLWAILGDAGWLDAGYRLVITSDHGEFLGDHGRVSHNQPWLYDAQQRVPLIYVSDVDEPELPEPISALAAYHLLKEGTASLAAAPPHAVSSFNPHWEQWAEHPAAAVWVGTEKLAWMGGSHARYDLVADPGEGQPLPIGAHPASGELDGLVKELVEALPEGPKGGGELMELMKAAGYVEDD